jgi:ABC-type branched-subunit amino acid transport system permease subunit
VTRGATRLLSWSAGLALVAALGTYPLYANGYYLAIGISILYFTILATAWAMFSGPTRYISLATVAFFGLGAYTAAVLGETWPWPFVLLAAAALGALVAAITGLSTLRLSGIYFVIFSFGLAELIRQLVIWYEVNVHKSVGRYLFSAVTQDIIYWQLLGLTILVFAAGWLLGRSRYGLALRAIGADETAAGHSGINATRIKLAVFMLSAVFMSVTGAVMAPRWTYIDPSIASASAVVRGSHRDATQPFQHPARRHLRPDRHGASERRDWPGRHPAAIGCHGQERRCARQGREWPPLGCRWHQQIVRRPLRGRPGQFRCGARANRRDHRP